MPVRHHAPGSATDIAPAIPTTMAGAIFLSAGAGCFVLAALSQYLRRGARPADRLSPPAGERAG